MMTTKRLEDIRKAVAHFKSRGDNVAFAEEMLAEVDRLRAENQRLNNELQEMPTFACSRCDEHFLPTRLRDCGACGERCLCSDCYERHQCIKPTRNPG
jgi:predicted SprT family Zn-dependent metalloprotease